MAQRERLPLSASTLKGYRLHKLEVFNWGTFDGQVYTVRPEGKSTLLVGQNGSGKSTLVDALLTLLVKPGVRNFNVAAGAKKRERDERTYLRGAYDRGSGDDGQVSQPKFLRPKGDQYSVILACFRNGDTGRTFTAAQLLYLAADMGVEKVYCLAEDERSIQTDFGRLESTEGMVKTLQQRGFRATKKFQEFEGWFNRLTRVKPKAMQVFNQTVAVKDIQRLNDFIRDHMLEPPDWDDRLEGLLAHFAQLSDAHDSLLRVRQQFELLAPVAHNGGEYRRQSESLAVEERLLDASDAYFAQRTIDLYEPATRARQDERERVRAQKDRLTSEQESVQNGIWELKNQINHAGGDRLRQIPLLIDSQQAQAVQKRAVSGRYHDALAVLGVVEPIGDEAAFTVQQQRLPALFLEISAGISREEAERDQSIQRRGEVRRDLTALREELAGLHLRKENIPEWCVVLRKALCHELGLDVGELPFAAELMQVRPEERAWEASLEKVLHGFALSLLVPEKFYHLVTRHVDGTRLTAQGRGRRLVYFRVAAQVAADEGPIPDSQSLIRKLEFRDRHALLPWLKAELSHRFNYRCCDTVEQFAQCRGAAMTRQRHVKSGTQRHDKDDRDEVADPRNYVLGWDNAEKKRRLAAAIELLEREEARLEQQLHAIALRLETLRAQRTSAEEAQRVVAFGEIDFEVHEREIEALERERRAIEDNSDVIRELKQRLAAAEKQSLELRAARDQAVAREGELDKQIAQAGRIIDRLTQSLQRLEESGRLPELRASFPDLDERFSDDPLTVENVHERENEFRKELDRRIAEMRKKLDPVRDRLLEDMSRFLQYCPEKATDLRPAVDYLDSFLGLRQKIIEDDLPRHEQRFKERLNQKVIEEIGLFRSGLDQERRAIEDKIELLNQSLKKVEYRCGAHIQLEPRPMRDPEIAEFQGKLRECVDGYFDDSAEANEARFLRIKDLVVRLRDENNRRWRDKVTDVRRWFNFVAAVIRREDGKAESIYEDSTGQSGGEKAKLAFTILVAAIAYQYDLDPDHPVSDRFHFVVVDEMFSKVDDQHAQYALDLFQQFGLQLLIVAPLDAKARVTEPYVGCYLHVTKTDNRSAIFEMSAREFAESMVDNTPRIKTTGKSRLF